MIVDTFLVLCVVASAMWYGILIGRRGRAELQGELEDCRLAFIDCMKSRHTELRRLQAAVRTHPHECPKCGDCGFWDRFERPGDHAES